MWTPCSWLNWSGSFYFVPPRLVSYKLRIEGKAHTVTAQVATRNSRTTRQRDAPQRQNEAPGTKSVLVGFFFFITKLQRSLRTWRRSGRMLSARLVAAAAQPRGIHCAKAPALFVAVICKSQPVPSVWLCACACVYVCVCVCVCACVSRSARVSSRQGGGIAVCKH